MLKDVTILVIGAFIGIVSNRFQGFLDKRGELLIYYRRINAPKNKGWGIINGCFMIPMNIDFLNTSNVNKVVRDFSLYIYGDDEKVKKFIHANMSTNSENEKSIVKTYGQVNDRYSFLIGPKSIITTECLFMLKTSELKIYDNYKKIVVRYYDENNHRHEYELSKFEYNGQNSCSFNVDEDWIKLN